jgi:hypothetical protein
MSASPEEPAGLRRSTRARTSPSAAASPGSPSSQPAEKKPKASPAKKPGAKTPDAAAAPDAPEALVLDGRCACGGLSWKATGAPKFTFYCHCSLCRRASGAPFVAAAAFDPDSVAFTGAFEERTPANSKVPRRFCNGCGTYVCEDARPVLGVYCLPVGLCDAVGKAYAPTQHIFWDSRIVEAFDDSLDKWMQMPGGAKA